eukprot:132445-Chlamydomonas_euryale.AAC.1
MDGALGAASPAPLARADVRLLRPPSAAVEPAVQRHGAGRDGARPGGPLGTLGGRGGDCCCPGHGGAGERSPSR